MSDRKPNAIRSGILLAVGAAWAVLCWSFDHGIWIPILVIVAGSALIVSAVAVVDAMQRRDACPAAARAPAGG